MTKQVIIYGRDICPNCTNAKELCEKRNLPFVSKTVGVDVTKELLEEMVGRTIRTVPQIFIMEDGFAEYVGGFSELRQRFLTDDSSGPQVL